MWIRTCTWVRARLPLLAGGDSLGFEHRVVERHLLRCPSCRHRLEALRASQSSLETLAARDPLAGAEPRSLWPALARQIRDGRRLRPAWSLPLLLERFPTWLWPSVGLASAAVVLLAAFLLWPSSAPEAPSTASNAPIPSQLYPKAPPPRLLGEELEDVSKSSRSSILAHDETALRRTLEEPDAISDEPNGADVTQ